MPADPCVVGRERAGDGGRFPLLKRPALLPMLPASPFKSLEVQDGARENLFVGLKIGELSRATGTTAPTIRYCEEIGLLASAGSAVTAKMMCAD
jgi:MerR family regulatory protein